MASSNTSISPERRAFWADPANTDYREDPAFGYIPFVAGKDVLEIGPGSKARQRVLLAQAAKSYRAADICNRRDTWLIKSYDTDFGDRYDLVFFWCVMHHVPVDEAVPFAEFCMRHTRLGGYLWFNAPHEGEKNDGIGTTGHPREAVLAAFLGCEEVCVNGDIYLLRRVS